MAPSYHGEFFSKVRKSKEILGMGRLKILSKGQNSVGGKFRPFPGLFRIKTIFKNNGYALKVCYIHMNGQLTIYMYSCLACEHRHISKSMPVSLELKNYLLGIADF